jgi:hypothetical protein
MHKHQLKEKNKNIRRHYLPYILKYVTAIVK